MQNDGLRIVRMLMVRNVLFGSYRGVSTGRSVKSFVEEEQRDLLESRLARKNRGLLSSVMRTCQRKSINAANPSRERVLPIK